MRRHKFEIPKKLPSTVEGCFKIIEKIEYESHDPMFQFGYDFGTGSWRCGFKEPKTFRNPVLKSKSAITVLHEFLNYFKRRPKKTPNDGEKIEFKTDDNQVFQGVYNSDEDLYYTDPTGRYNYKHPFSITYWTAISDLPKLQKYKGRGPHSLCGKEKPKR